MAVIVGLVLLTTGVVGYMLTTLWFVARTFERVESVMATLADIQAAVSAETTVEGSVITLLQTLSADLKAAIASNDPVAMQAVVSTIEANTLALSNAVAANTPAATPAPAAAVATPPAPEA